MKDVPFEVELDEQAPGDKSAQGTSGESRLRGESAAAGGEPPVLSVSQLTRRIRGLLEEEFPLVLVEGELSNVKGAASGHWYFNLKDAGAQVRCVMFRSAAASLRFTLEDGLAVVLRGRLSVYEQRGEYQIQVLTVEPQGTGALQLAFEQLKRRLEAEGLFDPARKRPLPYLPRRIGVVTSPHGAAIRDILHVLERRFPGLPVLLYPAVVQGAQAAGEIAAGIAALNRLAPAQKIDVIIVGRGGGSVEDLWAFNEEPVARAIHASAVPVISAVGHETDFTIADFVADVRAPTPSAAAEIAVPNRLDLLGGVEDLRAQLFAGMRRAGSWRLERWEALRARLSSPDALIRQHSQRLDDLWERVRAAGRARAERARERLLTAREKLLMLRPDRFHALQRRRLREHRSRLGPALRRHVAALRERLAAQAGLLDSLSPLGVMRRGYGVVRRADGRLLRGVAGVRAGDAVEVRLADGALDADVRGVRPLPEE
ncbi:MAG TPA: exodeoxyribonuclease VII large subunit [bacterium]